MYAKPDYHLRLGALVLSCLLLGACGKANDLPSDVSASLSSNLTSSVKTSASDDELKAALPKILKGLADIKTEIKGLQVTTLAPASGGATKPGTSTKPSSPSTTGSTKPSAPSTGSGTKPASSPSSAPAAPTTPAAPAGDDELHKVMKTMADAPLAQANIEKSEKSFADGHVSTGKLMMYTKQPNLVKIDVIQSSAGGNGTKVLYTSGEGDKIKVRPGGALSFVTTELGKHEDAADSTNRYTLDQLDLFGIVKRLNTGYSAELVGKTQLNGTAINVLKVSTKGTNSLDTRITYEYIGYDPVSYKLALWECYSAASKDPFMRIVISKLEFPASLPDSAFKL